MIHALRYIDVLMCMIYNCLHWIKDSKAIRKTGQLELLIVCREDYQCMKAAGRWMCRHMVETDSAYWNGEAVAAWQLANAPLWIKNDQWAYCPTVLWRSYRQRLITYYSACMLLVEPYRLTVLRHHWHCCICSYCHYFNQLRLAWWLRRTLSRIADDMVYSSRREARELEAVQWCVDELWPHL